MCEWFPDVFEDVIVESENCCSSEILCMKKREEEESLVRET